MAKRGQLTPEIKRMLEDYFGRESSVKELRLMPYAIDRLMNDSNLDPKRIDGTERKILSLWRKEKRVSGGASDFTVDEGFFAFMAKVIFVAYVDYENRDQASVTFK